jgi:hypothetical protein
MKWATALGDLREVSAEFPHPQGTIRVHFERNGDALTGTVTRHGGSRVSLFGTEKNRRCGRGRTRLIKAYGTESPE